MKIKQTPLKFILKTISLTLAIAVMVPFFAVAKPEGNHTYNFEVAKEQNALLSKLAMDFDKEELAAPNGLVITDAQFDEIETYVKSKVTIDGQTQTQIAAAVFNEVLVKARPAAATERPNIDPYDVFKNGASVCGGYSALYKTMLATVGIPSLIVNGYVDVGAAHAWNMVFVDGKWIYADATFGDAVGGTPNQYFNQTLEDFSRAHMPTYAESGYIDQEGIKIGYYNGVAVVGVVNEMPVVYPKSKYKDMDITAISEDIFSGEGDVELLYVPATVKYIGTSISIDTLKTLAVDPDNAFYASVDGVLFTKDLKELIVYPKLNENTEFTLPKETTTYDFKTTFEAVALQNLFVEEGSENFSSYDGAIYNKDKTALLTVPNGKKDIKILASAVLSSGPLSFKTNLEQVILEDGITQIPENTFRGTALKELYIPSTVTTINENAFGTQEIKGLIIYGKEGTAAATFAQSKGIVFKTDKYTEPTPNITIDFVREELTGFDVNKKYAIDGVDITPKNGIYYIEDLIGKTFNVITKGNGAISVDSIAQTITIPARPAAPSGVYFEDNKIKGVNSKMEYCPTGVERKDVVGTEITDLIDDNYYIYYKAVQGESLTSNCVVIKVLLNTIPKDDKPFEDNQNPPNNNGGNNGNNNHNNQVPPKTTDTFPVVGIILMALSMLSLTLVTKKKLSK
ncbi:MAG: leucine-rich repeat protein [Clostridia bacterium]